ncbi:MAG TPA: hypothetical protein PKY30_07600 [Myxococcota bacterium]|nr:hypothetical protein [Myxococcota bacterium]HNH46885.1 hypothetical protein [Myxococcota bacterium]
MGARSCGCTGASGSLPFGGLAAGLPLALRSAQDCGCSEQGASPSPIFEGDLRNPLSAGLPFPSWCATCRIMAARRRDPNDATARTLEQSWLQGARSSCRPGYACATIDNTGSGKCSTSQINKLIDAVKFIQLNIADVPSTCTKNSIWFCFHSKNFCIGNPRKIVKSKLSDRRFNIHCNNCSMQAQGTAGFTSVCDTRDIHICKSILDGTFVNATGIPVSFNTAQIACIIVHEIMHTAGADETAAMAMAEGVLPWNCNL